MLLYILSFILIATGLTFPIIFETLTMKIIGVSLSLLGIAILIARYSRILKSYKTSLEIQKGKQLKEKEADTILIRELQEQISDKEIIIEQLNQRIQKHSGSFPTPSPKASLEQRFEVFRKHLETTYDLDSSILSFLSELKRAAKNQDLREEIKNCSINPFIKKLNDIPLPIDETNKQELLGDLMQISFVSIDFMQEYHSTYDGLESLSLRAATKAISREDAAEQAVRANTNVRETEKTWRVLLSLATSLNLTDRKLIVHDILLQ